MKKNNQGPRPQNKRDIKRKNTKPVEQHTKSRYVRDIRGQLAECETFIDHVNSVLMTYGQVLDGCDGDVGDDSKEMINILETINADLHNFDADYQLLTNEVNAFINSEHTGELIEWLPETVDLVTRIDSLLKTHANLFALNQQTLMFFDINPKK